MKNLKMMTAGLCVLAVCSCSTKTGTGALIGTGAGAAIGGAVGAGTGAIIGKHMDKVAAEAAKIESAKVEEVTDANGLKAVKATFDSGLLFASSKAVLSTASKNDLAKFATMLKNNTGCQVDVYGHTDSTGNDGINNPLSNQRAQSVVDYLVSCGVSRSQFANVVGKGSKEPVADNSTAAGRQANRRVELYLYASKAMIEAANNGTLQ